MIRSIELINWKTHRNTKLDFKNGVNVLIGIMGAGKSSVLDAISFALFGTFPALKSRKIASNDLITNRPEEEQEAKVRLEFEVDGNVYAVLRTINLRSSSTAKLERNGEYLQTQAERVNEEIGHLLKTDYETFSRAIYAEQNNLDYFLELTKSDRKKQIDGMLGLDQFAAAEDNATSLINSIKSMIGDEESTLAQIDMKSYKAQLGKLGEELAGMEKEQISLKATEKKTAADVDSIRKKLDEAKALQSKKAVLEKEIAAINGKTAAMEDEIAKINKLNIDSESVKAGLKAAKESKAAVETALDKLGTDLKDATSKAASLSTAIESNEKKAKDRDAILAKIKGKTVDASNERVKKCEISLRELNDSMARNRALGKEVAAWLEELKKHIGKCPLCERELDGALKEKLLKDKSALMGGIDKELSELGKRIPEAEAGLKAAKEEAVRVAVYTSKLKDYEGIENAIAKDRTELAAIKPKCSALEKDIKAKGLERDAFSESINKLNADMESTKRKAAYVDELARAGTIVKRKTDEMKAIAVDDKLVDAMRGDLEGKAAELSGARARLSSSIKYTESLRSQIDEKAKQVANFEVIEARIAKRRDHIGNLNKFKSALMETEALLRNMLVSSINSLMNGLWPELYPYGDYRRIRLTSKKDDYLLEADLGRGGAEYWASVDAVASGGERTIACLAMRVAMSMVIVPNLKWIILDEPTHNLDSNGISRLINVLGENLPKVVDQIFVITHEESMKQIGSAIVYTLDRDKSVDGPTTVSEL